jgi:CubicO group peptidase (beta-lactamase class C family)
MLIAISVFGTSQTNNEIKTKTKQYIDSSYTELIKKYEIAGTSIAIVDNGKIVYSQGYGFSDIENNVKTTDNSVFRIGSCTKSFTALSVMKLQEEGKLSVDNTIQNYIPELSMKDRFEVENSLRIQDILTHTSGLPGDILNGAFCDNPPTTAWTINQLNQQTYASPNGYQLAYSNVGYELLGETIARLSGKTYSEYIKSEIFSPLGMKSSWVKGGETPIGYLEGKRMLEPQIRDQSAGLIHSNAVDMGNYLLMLLNKGTLNGESVVTPASINEMEKNHIQNVVFNNNAHWGYGLYTKMIDVQSETDTFSTEIVGHGGDTWAFHADFKYIPELGIGAIILTNTDKGTRIASASSLLKKYLKLEYSKSIKNTKKEKNYRKSKESIPTEAEINGFYGIGPYHFNVENVSKLKLKMGFGKIVLKLKNDSMVYTGKLYLLGMIPIKLKRQEFQFVKFNNEIFLKNIDVNSKQEYYESRKMEVKVLPKQWKEMKGKYVSINDFECVDCPSDLEKSTLQLKEKDGMMYFKVETTSWVKGSCFLEIINESIAVTEGIGRGSGETVKILANGNVMYSGYEFKRK